MTAATTTRRCHHRTTVESNVITSTSYIHRESHTRYTETCTRCKRHRIVVRIDGPWLDRDAPPPVRLDSEIAAEAVAMVLEAAPPARRRRGGAK